MSKSLGTGAPTGTTTGTRNLDGGTEVSRQFNILDTSAANDSAANGNGAGQWASATSVTPTQLGTTGLGAGAKPEIGRAAAEEAMEEIRAQVGSGRVIRRAGSAG